MTERNDDVEIPSLGAAVRDVTLTAFNIAAGSFLTKELIQHGHPAAGIATGVLTTRCVLEAGPALMRTIVGVANRFSSPAPQAKKECCSL